MTKEKALEDIEVLKNLISNKKLSFSEQKILEEVINFLEKEIPNKPNIKIEGYVSIEDDFLEPLIGQVTCPKCGNIIYNLKDHYCGFCGQRLKYPMIEKTREERIDS